MLNYKINSDEIDKIGNFTKEEKDFRLKNLDYLAYNYLTDGGGTRFRKAKNLRKIKGFLFQDYINYKPQVKISSLDSLPHLFEKDSLEILSIIENKNIKVEF